ncbi:MAG: N-acetyl-gamma-glutamyl-phosphate reductase [Prevotellaceae bacterium]|nr:N-acetyl-gamma-glutamyl-phosphate reductase [Prevotellaceae bacterium]
MIRLLLNQTEAEIAFAHSESNAGNLVSDVHEGLTGETEMRFSSEMPFQQVDVIFLCFGHGKSEKFLAEHEVPSHVRIIDLAQDFRIGPKHVRGGSEAAGDGFVYGLPEVNRQQIEHSQRVANPGCFATCVQLGLLPLAKAGLITEDVSVNALTGSTGAGQKPAATTHFSWRMGNISVYKLFTHQHLHEICQTLNEIKPAGTPHIVDTLDEPQAEGVTIDFIPYRGDFTRGIFCTEVVRLPEAMSSEEVAGLYRQFYATAAFTHYCDKALDLKQVVNTNKGLVHVDVFGRKVVVTSVIDNLLKGAVGQAVQNMNLMFSLPEKTGLGLKASAF